MRFKSIVAAALCAALSLTVASISFAAVKKTPKKN